MSRDGISPNMMLLHLRWQQMRLELLQQVAHPPQSESNASQAVVKNVNVSV